MKTKFSTESEISLKLEIDTWIISLQDFFYDYYLFFIFISLDLLSVYVRPSTERVISHDLLDWIDFLSSYLVLMVLQSLLNLMALRTHLVKFLLQRFMLFTCHCKFQMQLFGQIIWLENINNGFINQFLTNNETSLWMVGTWKSLEHFLIKLLWHWVVGYIPRAWHKSLVCFIS